MKFQNICFLFILLSFLSFATSNKASVIYPGVATGALHILPSSVHPGCEEERLPLNYLHNIEGCRSWAALSINTNQWVIFASPVMKTFYKIQTTGRPDANQFVSSYRLEYTRDGIHWKILGDFSGNTDSTGNVENRFDTPITALALRLHPKTWTGHISMKAEVFISDSNSPVLVENANDRVPAIQSGIAQVTANELLDGQYQTSRITLNYVQPGAQGSCSNLAGSQFFQVSTGIPQKWVAIATQRRGDAGQYVSEYHVAYTTNGYDWVLADDGFLFKGNVNDLNVVTNEFKQPFTAISVRLIPRNYVGHICLRMELYYVHIV